jgi:hypothetical protein
MDYAAQFAQSYLGGVQSEKERKSKELMTLLPALAAQGQIQPGGPISFGGAQLGVTPWTDRSKTPLPGFENVPGITDWSDVSQREKALEDMAWAKGEVSWPMAIKQATQSVQSNPFVYDETGGVRVLQTPEEQAEEARRRAEATIASFKKKPGEKPKTIAEQKAEAQAWLIANPNDPRANAVRKKLRSLK